MAHWVSGKKKKESALPIPPKGAGALARFSGSFEAPGRKRRWESFTVLTAAQRDFSMTSGSVWAGKRYFGSRQNASL